MAKVSRRGGFSDRNLIKPENVEIQLKEFDKRTRIQLQNMVSSFYDDFYGSNAFNLRSNTQDFLKFVLGDVYSEPINANSFYDEDATLEIVNETIANAEYDDVLTLIEALIQYWDDCLKKSLHLQYYNDYSGKYTKESLYEIANNCFEREYIGYRFVDGIIVPISDSYEVDTINETISSKYDSVYEHISKANRLLADRDMPDYENSIKESISAVEAISEIITGKTGREATLGNMLKKMEENGIKIHKGLKSAFNTLYGYTSDAKGIRHAGDMDGPSATFEEAKFMLVACCAFINYLTSLISD